MSGENNEVAKQNEREDFLDRPVKADVRFRFSSIPVAAGMHVVVPPLITDGDHASEYFDDFYLGPKKRTTVRPEDLDSCYFCLFLAGMGVDEEPPAVELPVGFYCNEFLSLNPLDISELLKFQQRYGWIRGARKIKPLTSALERLRPEPDDSIFAGIYESTLRDQRDGIIASQAIFDTVPDEELQEERILMRQSAVTFHEAIATVMDVQRAIRDSTRVLRDDLPPMTNREVADAMLAVDYVAMMLNRAFPSIRLVIVGAPDQPTDLITAVLAQLARGLLNNEAYRVCANPECGKLFTPRDMGRRLDTKYCSSTCQERAKRLRYIARHQEDGDNHRES